MRPHDKNPSRRALLAGIGLGLASTSTHAGEADEFIERAFAMRQRALDAGDRGYGAIVVKAGSVVAEAPSRVITRGDPTAHAEMEAIRDAARVLGRDLSGAVLYSSSPPCPMCEAAAYWAGIDRLHHGRPGTDGGPPRLCG